MTKPSIRNQQEHEREGRRECERIRESSRGYALGFRPILCLHGGFEPRVGFRRLVTVYLSSAHFSSKVHTYENAGTIKPPAYNVQREAGINFPVAWNVAQNGYVVINHCSIWSVQRSNHYMRESKDLRFHVLFYVDEGNKSVEFGWTQEDPRGTADFSVVIDRPTKKEPGLWFCVRTLS